MDVFKLDQLLRDKKDFDKLDDADAFEVLLDLY
mgnify:CR=1 FL=1